MHDPTPPFLSDFWSDMLPSSTEQRGTTHNEDKEDDCHDNQAELSRDVLAVLQGVRQAPVVLKRVDHPQHHFLSHRDRTRWKRSRQALPFYFRLQTPAVAR